MWVKYLIKFMLVFQFVVLSSEFATDGVIDNHTASSTLPNIWDDEVVLRMMRDVVFQDFAKENENKRLKRQYKRDIQSSATSKAPEGTATRKTSSPTTSKTKKPTQRVTQTEHKLNLRVTTTASNTVKPLKSPTITMNPSTNSSENDSVKTKPSVQPTKYHYYPHNQLPYFLPECAIQQVCNAVYIRLNFTQPLCVCPSRYRDPCSLSLNEDDNHTISLVGNANKKAVTLAKTCEQANELRDCRAPRDWSILALQNTRTGKSHYLVICKCPSNYRLEGPLPHDQPTYAGLPGINVYGMLCVTPNTPTKFNWRISQRPVIHTTYRAKNTTIEADNSNASPSDGKEIKQ